MRNIPKDYKPVMRPMPVAPVQPVQPPTMNAPKSNWDKFKAWLKDNRVLSGSLSSLSRLEILNKYKDYLILGSKAAESIGYGKRKKSKMISHPDKLCKCIHQNGGNWSDFTSWLSNAGRKVGSAFKTGADFVYKKAIRPALEYARDKPLTTLSGIAKVGSYLPIPGVSQGLSAVSTALGTAGTLTGKGYQNGQSGGSRKSHNGKVLMVF